MTTKAFATALRHGRQWLASVRPSRRTPARQADKADGGHATGRPRNGSACQHVSRQGDSIGGIARLYGVSPYGLMAANPWMRPGEPVAGGAVVQVPAASARHAVHPQPVREGLLGAVAAT